jgi:simple sugar transport system ATP-binding protein
VGIVFITHNPHHAYPIGDRFVILRRGEVQGDFGREEVRLEDLTSMMAGGEELERLAHELDRAGASGGAQ